MNSTTENTAIDIHILHSTNLHNYEKNYCKTHSCLNSSKTHWVEIFTLKDGSSYSGGLEVALVKGSVLMKDKKLDLEESYKEKTNLKREGG
jgi:hypothetical protein